MVELLFVEILVVAATATNNYSAKWQTAEG
jgi:hypothetical protein